ncbi:alpha/beta hydrolase [Pararhodobacter sp.]|uniref:alpha/beta fold hydrolase n=1 Tax=Pararhodobacter sp. TaxID=2127056 RepID=UPI002AFF36F7|nr:alpha/beta hydrolase [Pararhodobacter sp.]
MTRTLPDYSVTGDGPVTVFLLHGAFGAKEYWRNQLRAFSAAGLRIVAWDAPGYGCSPLPDDFSVETASEALVRLIEREGTQTNIILGHSMGGMVAIRTYGMIPDAIDGLVLSATSAAFGRSEGEWQKAFVQARVAPLDEGRSLEDFAPEMLRAMFAPGITNTATDLVIRVVSQMKPETFRAAIEAVTRFDARDVLPRMTVPVLCIAGGHDLSAAPPKVMEKMATKIAKGEFQCMDHVGHFGWAEDPEDYNTRVLAFLKGRIPAVAKVMRDVPVDA